MRTTDLRLPTPSRLYDALTLTLGLYSGCEPGIDIHMERLFFPTLIHFGIDKEKRNLYESQGLLYPPEGNSHAPTLWRKFQLAFRYMRERCIPGEEAPRVYQETPRYYKLTFFGAYKALELLPLYGCDVTDFFTSSIPEKTEDRENLTLLWFNQNWSEMQPKVRQYLAKHLARSEKMGLTDDHISTFIERAIRRDSFRKHLAAGNKIYPSTLCNFVARSAYTEMRGWGSDPTCRAIRGAVTERDRRKNKEFHNNHPNFSTTKVFSKEYARSISGIGKCSFEGQDEGVQGGSLLDSFGGNFEQEIVGMLNMDQTVTQIRQVLRRLPEPDTHFEILMMKELEGMSYREIARIKSIPVLNASKIVKKALQTLHKAVESGDIDRP